MGIIGRGQGAMGSNLSAVELGDGFEVKEISTGNEHSCVLSTESEIKCFGNSYYGQTV